MDEIWERAVETALEGENDVASVRTLTLDGAAKCLHGRLPQAAIFEKFENLQHLSIANIGLSTLEQFPRLRNLQKLVLSDNRIAGGLEYLVAAGLESLQDLDLSNNRISDINDLRPLAELRLVSLDLYECPVTRVKDYRSRAFGMISGLKYLDKMDVEGNERPESDDDDDEEDEDEEQEQEQEQEQDIDESGGGEVEEEDRQIRLGNGSLGRNEEVFDVDEDEESDTDEEVTENATGVNSVRQTTGSNHNSNGFAMEDEADEGEDDDESLEEIYEEDESSSEDDDVVEVYQIDDSDGVEEDDDISDEDEEIDNDEGDFEEPGNAGRLTSAEGEIDGHEQGEDDNGEMGDGELGVEEDEDEEEDNGTGYLVQPVRRVQLEAAGPTQATDAVGSDLDGEDSDNEDNQDGEVQELPTSSRKRKRDENNDDTEGENEEDDEDDNVEQVGKPTENHK